MKNKFETFFEDNEPYILTIISSIGFISSIALTIRSTIKANNKVHDLRNKAAKQHKPEPTKKELVKETYKYYILPMSTAICSEACSILSIIKTKKAIGTMATLYNASQTMFTEYRKNVVEQIGEEKEKKVVDSIRKKETEKPTREVVFAGCNDILCMDKTTRKTFRSSKQQLESTKNVLNAMLMTESYISLNDYYYELGLKDLQSDLGSHIGWNFYRDGLLDFVYESDIINGFPCLVVTFTKNPSEKYDKML